ncbi:hypothetical protein AAFF_G00121110, partial [Aldrovandia affinis]
MLILSWPPLHTTNPTQHNGFEEYQMNKCIRSDPQQPQMSENSAPLLPDSGTPSPHAETLPSSKHW